MEGHDILFYGLVGVACYPLALYTTGTVSMLLSRRIRSQSDLDLEIEIEKARLGLQDVEIKGRLVQELRGLFHRFADHSYVIEVGGSLANASTIRHEMNHIKRMEEGRSRLVAMHKPLRISDIIRHAYSYEELTSIVYEAFRVRF